MKRFDMTVDFNGIVIFDPARLSDYYGGIKRGHNVWRDFTTTNMGDEVVQQGIVVPLIGINDGSYEVYVRSVSEPSCWGLDSIKDNKGFPLRVSVRLVIADMAVLLDWYEDEGWFDIDCEPGFYDVDIYGYRKVVSGAVQSCGYDFVLTNVERLPTMTAELEKDMQVLTLEED
ncbi:hypothetical protein [Williamsia sp. CHRR-6]|uniref:hypothetical protein n=1 Tax=Williamsia sp. CHRR-6 TaxID=2835871 RepID=UPI001BDA7022|nr:hypothetical protein [Williamsia sp. CHRR-6]MBT0568224.1 hypothetical protein [Williamsia sp. CHRR-6]